jgi:hypothetical protein
MTHVVAVHGAYGRASMHVSGIREDAGTDP